MKVWGITEILNNDFWEEQQFRLHNLFLEKAVAASVFWKHKPMRVGFAEDQFGQYLQ